jgi:hypothetical protein
VSCQPSLLHGECILNGCLTWANQTIPEAFSIFSCFKPGLSTTDMSSDDFLALQLKSSTSEGKDVYNADISHSPASTKTIHQIAPLNEHQLRDFITSFALVLSLLFGLKSTICEAMGSWVTHICNDKMV